MVRTKKVKRAWGWYEILAKGTGFKILKLFVKPYKRTPSGFRATYKKVWVFLYGDVKVIDRYSTNQFVNYSNKGVRFIEVQVGEVRNKRKRIQ